MPPHGKEVQLTQLEVDLMAVFVKWRILDDATAMEVLLNLYSKIAGNYAQNNPLRDKEDRI